MAGRKYNISPDYLKSIFEENIAKIIDARKKVTVPGDEIWEKIREKVGGKKLAKTLYNDALKWWAEKDVAEIDANIEQPNEPTDISEPTNISIEISAPSDCESDESYFASEDEAPQADDINFSISLSHEVWETIQPVEVQHRRKDKSHQTNTRLYHELPPGLWTNVLSDRIAQHRIQNPCTWTFKRAKVHPNGKKYINISGLCTTCDAILIAIPPIH